MSLHGFPSVGVSERQIVHWMGCAHPSCGVSFAAAFLLVGIPGRADGIEYLEFHLCKNTVNSNKNNKLLWRHESKVVRVQMAIQIIKTA